MTTTADEKRKKEWPRYGISPDGGRAKFDCIGDLPFGWRLEHPLPGTEEATDPELAGLRAAYSVVFGKKPGPQWDSATLREKLAEKAA